MWCQAIRRRFPRLLKSQTISVVHSTSYLILLVFFWVCSDRKLTLTTHFHPVSRLGISGGVYIYIDNRILFYGVFKDCLTSTFPLKRRRKNVANEATRLLSGRYRVRISTDLFSNLVQIGSCALRASCWTGNSVVSRKKSDRFVKMTTHLHLLQGLRIGGTIPPIPHIPLH